MNQIDKPLIVGLGGTLRPESSCERALACALRGAEAGGARTRLLGGEFLAKLPMLDPRGGDLDATQREFLDTVREADGIIVASPGYHGSISGAIKNALDTLEFLRNDSRPYLTDRAVGLIVFAAGFQAVGTALVTLRSVVHALRGWPTPFGAGLIDEVTQFDETGSCRDPKDGWQLETVGQQVAEFAMMRRSLVADR